MSSFQRVDRVDVDRPPLAAGPRLRDDLVESTDDLLLVFESPSRMRSKKPLCDFGLLRRSINSSTATARCDDPEHSAICAVYRHSTPCLRRARARRSSFSLLGHHLHAGHDLRDRLPCASSTPTWRFRSASRCTSYEVARPLKPASVSARANCAREPRNFCEPRVSAPRGVLPRPALRRLGRDGDDVSARPDSTPTRLCSHIAEIRRAKLALHIFGKNRIGARHRHGGWQPARNSIAKPVPTTRRRPRAPHFLRDHFRTEQLSCSSLSWRSR